jgi:glyoxylase-like metal-dependent hydrolase (beta-lactamase superfamily II)
LDAFDDLIRIGCPGINLYALRSGDEYWILDSGFIGGVALIQRAVKRAGWDRYRCAGILLTHGHLDHTLNVVRLAQLHQVPVWAPRGDAALYRGEARYTGLARVCGVMEGIGRALLGFTPFDPDRTLDDGEVLPIWRGLTVVALPGHTLGHCGYYCAREKLLFSGDLVASYAWDTHTPPDVFNADPTQIAGSVRKALALELAGILPNHSDGASPAMHLDRFRRLARRKGFL